MKAVGRVGLSGAVWVLGAVALRAQASAPPPDVPSAYTPPAGMCRVWLQGVPPVQQPAPTDCRSALRAKPVGATVIYGPESRRAGYRADDWSRPSLRIRGAAEPCVDVSRRNGCDETASGAADGCVDGGRDARCEESMPSMRSAVLWTEGQRPADIQRWFAGQNVAARFTPPARGGSPDRVQWFDIDNHLVQIWIDRNGDGRADRVELFNRDGARIRVVGQ